MRVLVSHDEHSGLIAVGLSAVGAALPHTVRVVDTNVGLLVEHMLGGVLDAGTEAGEALRVDLDHLIASAELTLDVLRRNPDQ